MMKNATIASKFATIASQFQPPIGPVVIASEGRQSHFTLVEETSAFPGQSPLLEMSL